MTTPEPRELLMPKVYDHLSVEQRLYAGWEASGAFAPAAEGAKAPFVIVMPPPNVTGELHHGHAMFVAFEDLLSRWRRMQGYPTLWLPGTDHAGIATQNVVERQLAESGLTRHDIGREEFVKRVWQWKQQYGDVITSQLRRLGASCDWSRERFTLDEGLSRAVRETFVSLYRKGLIYRGEYMINWCPRCRTALSDLEVEHVQVQSKLYYVRYPLEPEQTGRTYLTVATTRPETILGDTAIAVSPHDDRFKGLVGKMVLVPQIGRLIPIVADEAVDPAFGTGAVKVTPAHDPTDFQIAERHQLPSVSVIGPDGKMTAQAGSYAALDRFEARRILLRDLDAAGLLDKTEDYSHAPGACDRCGVVVEPLVSRQWFVRIKPLAEPAIEAVRSGHIRIVPERFESVYFNWMESIRDWCISRQLWWGHQIPVWYCECGQETATVETPLTCAVCGSANLTQDQDVLDTWFSSGLWPFSSLGWPDQTSDLRRFYPTSVMETGYDILFFWVARMIMLGLECAGDVPFRAVYLHGLMRDEKGEKMSKSKGNVADPLDVIAKYGADALRFAIVTGGAPGHDMKLMLDKVEYNRNFANKVWNIARYAIGALDKRAAETSVPELPGSPTPPLPARWILSSYARLVQSVTRLLEEFQFGEAGRQIQDFLWNEYADWYVECAKILLRSQSEPAGREAVLHALLHVLDGCLRLLHPFMPFVTEEIWRHMPGERGLLISASWPQAEPSLLSPSAEADMSTVRELVRAVRNARAEFAIEPSRVIAAELVSTEKAPLLRQEEGIIAALARLSPISIQSTRGQSPETSIHLIIEGMDMYLPLAGIMEIPAELLKTEREISATRAQLFRLQERLENPHFTSKAPQEVVARENERRLELATRLAKLEARLHLLSEA